MSNYAEGFAAGEQAAWADRHVLLKRQQAREPVGEYSRGWWDGYRPRSLAWQMRTDPREHWQREAA